MINHVNEVTGRGGRTISVAIEHEVLRKNVHDYLVLSEADRFTVPIVATIPARLISYHMSVAHGMIPTFRGI
jgi:glucosamine 6-phosphate synthetase-like amidotransferase/phosphosugar isomerase protein